MRFLDETLIEKWEDGSIPKKAKGELVKKFNLQFHYTPTSNAFNELILKKAQPTPDQYQFLLDQITYYWAFYNEPQLAEKV
ncbi:hypothetical protein ACS5NO_12590 [Larkinella sp. GY13]|uniref:hypothetical protein n=1 Tax=Larkinella sp. GY13 TaxID=3453720 RepID=UPI003EEE4D55